MFATLFAEIVWLDNLNEIVSNNSFMEPLLN